MFLFSDFFGPQYIDAIQYSFHGSINGIDNSDFKVTVVDVPSMNLTFSYNTNTGEMTKYDKSFLNNHELIGKGTPIRIPMKLVKRLQEIEEAIKKKPNLIKNLVKSTVVSGDPKPPIKFTIGND